MTTTEQTVGGIAQLAPQDAEFVYNDGDRYNSNSTGIHFFDTTAESTPFSQDDAAEWMRERLGLSGIFTRRLRRVPFELDYPYWVPDASFDVARHVHVEPVDGPGWDALRGHVSRIAGMSIDLNRPPWEIHFITDVRGIEGLPDRMTVAIWRSHHAAGDGLASRDLCSRLFSPETAAAPSTDARLSGFSTVIRGLKSFPRHWGEFRRGIAATNASAGRVAAQVAAGEITEPPATRPATRFNRSITPDLTFDVVRFDPDEIRAVQAAMSGVTFNDILLATISGALAAYLAEHGEVPTESLAAMVPMSMRGTTQGVATHLKDQRANHLALLTVDLHTDITDPLERLAAVHRSAVLEKARHRNEDVRAAARRVETSPAWLLHLAGRMQVRRRVDGPTVDKHNTMISNIPWTGRTQTLRGAPMVWGFGLLGIVDGVGLRHLIISQDRDDVELSFCTDTAMMPDTSRYKELLLESFSEIAAAVSNADSRADSHLANP